MNERTKDMRHILDQIANVNEGPGMERVAIESANRNFSNLENRANDLNLSLERAGYFDHPDLEDSVAELFDCIENIRSILRTLEQY